jgi:hypothetical protein
MHKELEKLFRKKLEEKGPISEKEQKARDSVYDDLSEMADDEMVKPLKAVKAVKVMSNSKEGLEEGLDKAKQVLSHSEAAEDESEKEHEAEGEEGEEMEDMSEAELMKKLEEIKAALEKKKSYK